MTSTGLLLILIGLFVIVNSTNFVGVLQHNLAIAQTPTPSGG